VPNVLNNQRHERVTNVFMNTAFFWHFVTTQNYDWQTVKTQL